MIEKYKTYLELIESRQLKKYFEQQKDYICCKEGCSSCCETGQYPFSEIEYKYAMQAYEALDEQQKQIIQDKVKKIKKVRGNDELKDFMYECPFLINKKCSIYNNRGIICRTHGLLFFITDDNGNSRNKIPDCASHGLNYSSVYDREKTMISQALWEKSGIEAEPLAYNISLKALMNGLAAKELGLEFGELKTLVDWF